MPSPTVYAEADFDPFANVTADNVSERAQLFYATDRMPAGPDDPQAFYNNKRGHLLRTGVATVQIDPPLNSWEERLLADTTMRFATHWNALRQSSVALTLGRPAILPGPWE